MKKKQPITVDDLKAFSISESAERIGIARDTLYRMVRARRVRTVRMGDRPMVPIKELRRILENGIPAVGTAARS
jgi:excisionase family DNA binding protein